MRDSGKEEMESVVSGRRRMLVVWAHTMWAIACADDIHSHSPHTDTHHSLFCILAIDADACCLHVASVYLPSVCHIVGLFVVAFVCEMPFPYISHPFVV